tara:strand:+ start:113 stop:511 length:399 start_codon:yes stop_codon:yes gene_type:complete
MKDVFVNLDILMLQNLQSTAKSHIIILKFTANWCGPCKRTKSLVESHFCNLPDNALVFELDIDDPTNIPLYSALKSKRQINGIPALLAFYSDVERPYWYVPDASVNSSSVPAINNFFRNAIIRANAIMSRTQ